MWMGGADGRRGQRVGGKERVRRWEGEGTGEGKWEGEGVREGKGEQEGESDKMGSEINRWGWGGENTVNVVHVTNGSCDVSDNCLMRYQHLD